MFTSREEIEHYLRADEIECLICHRLFRHLGRHVVAMHGLSCAAYRAAWGLPAGTPLAGQATRAIRADILRQSAETGLLNRNPIAASQAAQVAGRGNRIAWERAEHAARVAMMRPGDHRRLPPGSKRRDGRDADTAREYQRQYRRQRDDR